MTTGNVSLLMAPVTYLEYKNLFYDSMGQKIKILDPKLDWADYRLDERELTDLIEIFKARRFTQIIGSVDSDRKRIEYRG
jgi:hypothetical protein